MAFELTGMHVKISADSAEYIRNLAKVDQATATASKKMQSTLKAAAGVVETASTSFVAVGAAALKMAADAKESESLFETSFEGMSGAARQWSVNLRKELGLNEYALRRNAGVLNVMFGSMGLATDKAYEMSTSLTKLAEDAAAFYNASPDEAFNKLKSGMTGEAEPLKAWGILVDETTVKTYAYATGIAKAGEELTQQQKVLARYQAIMAQTAKAQGALAREIDSPTNQLKIMRNEVNMLAIELGTELIPQFSGLIRTVRGTVSAYNELSPEMKDATIKMAAVAIEAGAVVAAIRLMALAFGATVQPVVLLSVALGAVVSAMGEFKSTGSAVYDTLLRISQPLQALWNLRNEVQERYGPRQGMGDFDRRTDDAKVDALTITKKKPDNPFDNADLGKGTKKTAFEQYGQETSKLISIWQSEVELNRLSHDEFKKLLQERLAGLRAIVANDDEILDKRKALLDLESQVKNIEQTTGQEAIEIASKRVQLGQMSIDEYVRLLEKQKESVKTDKEKLDLAVQIAAENAKIIARQIEAIERQAASERAMTSIDQENSRHRLAMQKILGSDRKSWAKEEYDLHVQRLVDEESADRRAIESKIRAYVDLKEKKGALSEEETRDYEKYLNERSDLDAKYRLEKLELDNEYAERAAEYQQYIIDANNHMITDLIIGTRSGHDILKDMWADFVYDVVSKMFSMKSEMNIFNELLGGLFGLGGSSGSSSSSGSWSYKSPGFSLPGGGTISLSGKRAAGGPVKAGKAYLVGEERPEVFVPNDDGVIIPDVRLLARQSQTAQSGSISLQPQINIQQNFQSLDPAENMRLAKLQNESMKNDILNSIRNESIWRSAIKGATQ